MSDIDLPDRAAEPWHFKREIQVGHLITTLTVAVSMVWYVSKLDQRIAVVESQIQLQHERDERQDKQNGDAIELLRRQLDKMDAKLDRLIEQRSKN